LKRILLVEDDRLARFALKDLLERNGFEVLEAADGPAALRLYRPGAFLAVITDLKMPGMNGIELLENLRSQDPHTAVIVITAYGTIETAVEAIRKGAFDYVTKPFEAAEILHRLSRVRELAQLREENRRLRDQVAPPCGLHGMVGKSRAMESLFALIRTIADSQATVLIQGESGTGKEMAARAIHALSPRGRGPFVAVSCAALPETLLESELFGYERHAFTGALRPKPGRFELAQKGTLFLDEIDDVPLTVQVKLLRAIQERQIERLGGTTPISLDVRILAATKRDLTERVREGKFREDLYYRLAVVPVRIPPLRERKEDIPLLVQHFLEKFSLRDTRPAPRLSAEAVEMLEAYDWPGNVRELENLVERLVLLCGESVCGADCLKAHLRNLGLAEPAEGNMIFDLPAEGLNLQARLDFLERRYIEASLKKCGGNKSKAAELLGLKRSTLGDRIAKLGIRTAQEG